jgi:outer membrane protein, multidrug efflux system
MSARSQRLLALACAAALAGCSMAPHYQRPAAPVPMRFGNATIATSGAGAAVPALPDWRAVFLDPRLRQVIALGLDNNRDLRVAMLDIDKARAQYRIQRAALAPSVDAGASSSRELVSASASGTGKPEMDVSDTLQVGISSWEVDLFGRVRSLKHEALETWLASAQTQRSVRLSLIGEIADDWLAVGADQQLLALAQQTLESQEQTLRRSRDQHDNGIVSGLDLAQIQSSVEAARVDVARDATQLAQARDALQLVVGAPVEAALLAGADAFDGSVALAPVPAQLDATVLLQRPDVLAAEHALKAANADIGAARAAFFPTLTLTAATGRSSDALSTLFAAGARTWSFVPSITAPIFHAGALKASLDVSKIGKDIAVAQYEKAIQSAFGEVADALAQRDHIDAQLAAQQALVEATRRSHALAQARYRAGVDDYLQVLDAQRALYAAQQDLIDLRLQDDSNRVALYTVLGGGADAAAASPVAVGR